MKDPWLIQRLQRPYNDEQKTKIANIFSFGGGLKNGGLTEEAASLLNKIFIFDYMGSAEFEFGAIPETLQKMIKNVDSLYPQVFMIKKKPIYVLAPKDPDLEKYLNNLYERKYRLKEFSGFKEAIDRSDFLNIIGWLDLDNHIIFFKDYKAFKKICKLFGKKIW